MPYNPEIHHRRSVRLKGFDYSMPAAYFITICTHNRVHFFGEINPCRGFPLGNPDTYIELNTTGKIAKEEWEKTDTIRKNVKLGEFVFMPNHLHAIIYITGTEHLTGGFPTGNPYRRLFPNTIGSILGQYKSIVTKRIRNAGCLHFKWQKNYFESIIKTEKDLDNIQNYILQNPVNWETDKYNV